VLSTTSTLEAIFPLRRKYSGPLEHFRSVLLLLTNFDVLGYVQEALSVFDHIPTVFCSKRAESYFAASEQSHHIENARKCRQTCMFKRSSIQRDKALNRTKKT
jgi:hypothetical protein